MTQESLRVELTEFCQNFSSCLNPFSDALEQSIQALRKVPDGEAPRTVVGELLDNQHRLKILRDKARQQHTYLVIFGPLKSGKSTLMNAISGAYVSEVSSLPAYPCLVYVHEGEAHGFSVTRFNGEETHFDSSGELQGTIETAHEELARKIREADEAERAFSPAQDFPEAIRRIDFTLPAPYLKESGTILVDTPGLYTKMKYNYGQLTRDFRDTAACAVFVVKTDNLFFEQVFAEFADLLEIFSRVFLVVNIDSSKQDLSPDGTLEPSLERENPRKIVEAFENLTVSARIRDAIESGQLRIYLIDLLRTATRSLQDNRAGPAPEAAEAETTPDEPADAPEAETGSDETPENEASGEIGGSGAGADAEAREEREDPLEPRLGFDTFLGDLSDFLNSSDYIIAFMADSLRQAHSILREVKEQIESPEATEFQSGIEALRENSEQAAKHLGDARDLAKEKWDKALDEMNGELKKQIHEHAASVTPELKEQLHGEIDDWFTTGESLRELLETRARPKLGEVVAKARERALERIDSTGQSRNSGLRSSAVNISRLQRLGMSFNDVYPEVRPTIQERLQASPELPDASAVQSRISVRKGFWDWLLFRSAIRIKRGIFGEDSPSTKALSPSVKNRRLGEEGKNQLKEAIDQYVEAAFSQCLEDAAAEALSEYRRFFRDKITKTLEEKAAELEKSRDSYKERYQSRRDVVDALNTLSAASDKLQADVVSLHEQFVAGKGGAALELDLDLAEEEAADASAGAGMEEDDNHDAAGEEETTPGESPASGDGETDGPRQSPA